MILTEDYTRIAATWSRLRMILMGLDDDVDTFGIMTAWNPKTTESSPEYNKEANTRLRADLNKHILGGIKVIGHFENILEGSLLIPNITREYLLELCHKYDQSSVVYGEKIMEEGKVGFRYELLDRDGNPEAKSKTEILFSGNETVDKAKTDFSAKGGFKKKEDKPGKKAPVEKKFIIPF